MRHRNVGRAGYVFAVGAILVLALGLRLFGHNWDSGWYLHPDERFIALVLTDRIHEPRLADLGALLDPAHSPLNPRSVDAQGQPRSYAYGSLPLYVTDFTAWLVGIVARQEFNTYARIGSIGRYITALLDGATVFLSLLFARRAYGRLAGILAGLLVTLSVVLIQLAHFFTTDAWVTFFASAALLVSLKAWEDPRRRWYLMGGVLLGAALATKVSIVVLGVPLAIAAVAPDAGLRWTALARRAAGRLVFVAAGTVAAFAIFEPYAILQPGPFLNDAGTQWEIVSGRIDVPFTRQFVGTVPGLYQLQNLIQWGLGPALGIAVLVGVATAVRRVLRQRSPGDVLLLGWIIPYFALIASAEAKFLRYVAPLVPALVILGAAWLSSGGFGTGPITRTRLRSIRGLLAVGMVAVVVVATGGWAAAFESIYTRPNPRVSASQWIFDHIPAGSTITSEYWDDSLPLPLVGKPPVSSYRQVTLDLYADRTPQQQFDYIAQALTNVDYIILSSDRLDASIPRLPWRYPVTAQYYALLESGQLGFRLVYQSDDEPQLGPWKIDDHGADESFTVYDHPRVRIYQRVQTLTQQQLQNRFAWALEQPWSPTREPSQPTLLLGKPVDQLPAADDLGWSAALTQRALAAIVVWLIALAVIGLLTLPATLMLFHGFPDLGWGFARLVGLLVGGYLVWIVVSLQLARFTLPWILGLLAIVAVAVWRGFRGRLRDIRLQVRSRLTPIVAAEVVFLVTFAFFLLLRSINSDLWQTYWGGEKPMEMAYTSAIARSATFPPYDPWYAGGVMNYYYYGFYLVALLWKVTGVPPEVGFQLAIATVAGVLASGVFSVATALGANLFGIRRPSRVIGVGLLGVLLMLFIGNLDAAGQILTRHTLAVDFWQSSRAVSYAITEFPYFTMSWADLHPHAIALPMTVLVIALAYAWTQRHQTNAEPARWSWLWLAAAALTIGSIAVTNSWDVPIGLLLLAAALVTGARVGAGLKSASTGSIRHYLFAGIRITLIAACAWLLFAPFLANFVALVGGVRPTSQGTAFGQYVIHFGIFLGILAMATLVVLRERRGGFETRPYTGSKAAPTLEGIHAGIGAVAGLAGFAVPTLLVGVSGTDLAIVAARAASAALIGGTLGVLAPLLMNGISPRIAVAAASLLAVVIGVFFTYRPTAAVLLAILAAAAVAWFQLRDRPAAAMVALCVAGAAGVTLGADVLYVVDDLSGSAWERMNTVFKFYLEGWTLYALAAAMGLAYLARAAARERPSQPLGLIAGPIRQPTPATPGTEARPARIPLATLGLAAAIVLIVGGIAYPAFATEGRLAQRMPGSPTTLSLDGLAWMRGSWIETPTGQRIDFSGDYAAIQWLRSQVTGLPVILEASIGPYRGNGSRISAATGFPDVLGWDRHQRQQRYAPGIDQRLVDVRTIYNTTDINEKLALLYRYDVRYIVVGDVERYWPVPLGFAGAIQPDQPYASAAGLAAFNEMVGTSLRVAFQSGHTTIYEVLPFPRLQPAPGTGTGQ